MYNRILRFSVCIINTSDCMSFCIFHLWKNICFTYIFYITTVCTLRYWKILVLVLIFTIIYVIFTVALSQLVASQPIDHDVSQCNTPYSPHSPPLFKVLQLSVPQFCLIHTINQIQTCLNYANTRRKTNRKFSSNKLCQKYLTSTI